MTLLSTSFSTGNDLQVTWLPPFFSLEAKNGTQRAEVCFLGYIAIMTYMWNVSPQVLVLEHLVSSCLGRLWNLKEVVSSWRKWVAGRVCLRGYSPTGCCQFRLEQSLLPDLVRGKQWSSKLPHPRPSSHALPAVEPCIP